MVRNNIVWIFVVTKLAASYTLAPCTLGTGENFQVWVNDDRGGLKFPDYNDVALMDDRILYSSSISEGKYNNQSSCLYYEDSEKVICKGVIDFDYLNTMRNKSITSFVVENYQSIQTLRSPNNESDSSALWKGIGEISSVDMNVGLKITMDLMKSSVNVIRMDGQAFSNEMHIGWPFIGQVVLGHNKKGITCLLNASSTGSDTDWNFMGLIEQTGKNPNKNWIISGSFSSSHIHILPKYNGKLNVNATDDTKSWTFSGVGVLEGIFVPWKLSGSVSYMMYDKISIPKGTFSGMNIKHIYFKDSTFLGDIDQDSLQELYTLETLTFKNAKIEYLLKLDLLLRNLNDLKAIYLEDSVIPNLLGGTKQQLRSLEYISFKGSGPINLDDSFLSWLDSPKLKYLNLQDCNIKVSSKSQPVLASVKETLRYLDISYTSLVEEDDLIKIFKGLSLTHLSGAGLQLPKIPKNAFKEISSTLQYLSLKGNLFQKIPEENMFDVIFDFPELPELKELDLSNCQINYIEKGSFDNLPKLELLYLSYNNIENLQDGWFFIKPTIKYIDLSYNAFGSIRPVYSDNIKTGDSFHEFEDLIWLTLSNGVFDNVENLITNLSGKIQALSLCNAGLKTIDKAMFQNKSELELLDLSYNEDIQQVDSITISTFENLTSLKYLVLEQTEISKLFLRDTEDKNTSMKLNLEFLSLRNNNIRSFVQSSLPHLQNLKYLDLSRNEILNLSSVFSNLNHKVDTIFLDNNKVETISPDVFDRLFELKKFTLGSNNFKCGCYINDILSEVWRNGTNVFLCRPSWVNSSKDKKLTSDSEMKALKRKNDGLDINFVVQNVVKNRGIKINFPHIVDCVEVLDWDEEKYTCHSASLGCNVPFRRINETDDCLPEMKDIENESLYSYCVAAIGILIGAILVYIIYWKWWAIRSITRAIKNAALLTLLGHGDYEPVPFQYNVFVSYSDKDRPWVLENLLPNLESWDDLTVCLHERDFQVGLSILENIVASMDKSKTIVLVLSQSFIKSQWCQYEMHLAQHRLVETSRDNLILILLEHIPKYKRPKTLRYLMMTKTYIEWPTKSNDGEEVRIFWKRLSKALNHHEHKKEPQSYKSKKGNSTWYI